MPEPRYQQIAKDLRTKIESGELPVRPGDLPPSELESEERFPLPSEAELRELYGASRNTIRDAVKWLVTRGLIETRPGQGTFVVEPYNPFVSTLTGDPGTGDTSVYIAEVEAGGRKPETSVPRVTLETATADLADILRIDEGTRLVCRYQQRLIDGVPYSRQSSYYPTRLVDEGASRLEDNADIEEGAVAYIAEVCGIKQVGYRDTIAVRPPDEEEIAFFNLPPDGRVSVFEIYRIAFDQNGDRFRLTITVYPSDRNRFVVNVGDLPTVSAHAGSGKG
jgi:GntR family transcriptional regulator